MFVGRLKLFLFCSFCICFLTCQPNPGSKKAPIAEKKTVSQSVSDLYNAAVDILFIIDDSGSMLTFLDLLAENSELFIENFFEVDFIDYHIGVTTSTFGSIGHGSYYGKPNLFLNPVSFSFGNSGKIYLYVDRDTPNGGEQLAGMMKVGANGNGVETFLDIPQNVLSEDIKNRSQTTDREVFYRDDAHLAIIVITDEDDQSSMSPAIAYRYLLDIKGGDATKIHYMLAAVLYPKSCKNASVYSGAEAPKKLMEMMNLFGDNGYQLDLCKSDYGKDLAHLSTHLVESVLTVPLNDLPDVTSIEVCYSNKDSRKRARSFCDGGQVIPNGSNGWTYDVEKNAIHFSQDIQLDNANGQFDIQYTPFYIDM